MTVRAPTKPQESIIADIIEEDVQRPPVTRGRWTRDPKVRELVQKVIETAETKKAYRVKLTPEMLKELSHLQMHLRYAVVRKGKLRLHTEVLPNHSIRVYAEKAETHGADPTLVQRVSLRDVPGNDVLPTPTPRRRVG